MKSIDYKTVNLRNLELFIYLVIWMAIFSVPYFQFRQFNIVNWSKVEVEWIRMSSFLVIFILNAFVFVPKLLFQKKYVSYVIYSTLTVILVIGISATIQSLLNYTQPVSMPPMNLGPGMPPMELGNKMPPPVGYHTPSTPVQKSLLMIILDNTILSILIIIAGTTIKMMSKWLTEEGRRKDVEKEQLKTELALLRHQVSPHFFMNTLNNIHALVDINTETAKDAIIRLSTLMRYLLYETTQGHTSLKKELEFIESYISLMQLRYSNKVKITFDVPKIIPEIQIPPMLFISLLENSFKHGVSYQSESFVSFKLEIDNSKLHFTIKNSKHKKTEPQDKAYSGIGLSNIRKSLSLLYQHNFTFNIDELNDNFEVQLIIPIYENKVFIH